MQRRKFCNADAPSTKPTNSYVDPPKRKCNAEKSAMQMQVREICDADATQMHAHASQCTKLAWKLQKLAWKLQKHAWKLQYKLHTCGSKGQEKKIQSRHSTPPQNNKKLNFPQPHCWGVPTKPMGYCSEPRINSLECSRANDNYDNRHLLRSQTHHSNSPPPPLMPTVDTCT